MNAAAEELLRAHLWRDEEVLWSAQPLAVRPVAAQAARRAFFNGLGAAVGSSVVALVVIGKATMRFGLGMFELALIAAVIGAFGFVAFRAASAWARGRVLAARTVYAVTNRRVVIVQGADELWIGRREIADVSVRGGGVDGGDITITRHLTDVERRQAVDGSLDERLADHIQIGTREVVLAAVPNPGQVLELLQTLQRSAAS